MKGIHIDNLVRPEVRGLSPYQVEKVPYKVKLDANESPYSLPQEVMEEAMEALRGVNWNRYPDPEASDLKALLSAEVGIPHEGLLLGNGSDELIQLLCLTFGGPVLAPSPSFAMYKISALSTGCPFIEFPLEMDFGLDIERMERGVRENQPKLVFLAYPNNPTGNCFSQDRVIRLIEASRGLVVIDEAYYDYSGLTFLPLLNEYSNLVILRTLSKIGLAGLRVGFLVAREEVVRELQRLKLPFNVNALSQAAAMAVLRRREALEGQAREVIRERNRLYHRLIEMEWVKPFPSEANFILFKTEVEAWKVFQGLLAEGILIRDFRNSKFLKDCLRVTVGRPEENDLFLKALSGVLSLSRKRGV